MPPMVMAAAIAAAGAVGGAALNSRAAGKASREQSTAALEAARIQDHAIRRAEAEQRRLPLNLADNVAALFASRPAQPSRPATPAGPPTPPSSALPSVFGISGVYLPDE